MKTKQNESSVVVFAGEEPVCKLLESGSDKELDSPSQKKKKRKKKNQKHTTDLFIDFLISASKNSVKNSDLQKWPEN